MNSFSLDVCDINVQYELVICTISININKKSIISHLFIYNIFNKFI